MKVLVTGGRDFTDRDRLFRALDEVHATHEITDIISGCARGADTLALEWCESRKRRNGRYIRPWMFPAKWKEHGKAAGPIRNQQMIDQKPDLVLAFPGGPGTHDMVSRAVLAGVPVVQH